MIPPEEILKKVQAVLGGTIRVHRSVGGEMFFGHSWESEKDCFTFYIRTQKVWTESAILKRDLWTRFYVNVAVGFSCERSKIELRPWKIEFEHQVKDVVSLVESVISDPWTWIWNAGQGQLRDINGDRYKKIRFQHCLKWYADRVVTLADFHRMMDIVVRGYFKHNALGCTRIGQACARIVGENYWAAFFDRVDRLEKNEIAARILSE